MRICFKTPTGGGKKTTFGRVKRKGAKKGNTIGDIRGQSASRRPGPI